MNKKRIRSLTKYQIGKANEFIENIKKNHPLESFGQVMERLYAGDKVFFKETLGFNSINLSSGTSQIKTFTPYLNLIASDLKKHKYYRDYSSPQGSQSLRQAIAIFESLKLGSSYSYEDSDVCLTEGATGAISSVFEYFYKKYPDSHIVIPVPSYYLFKLVVIKYGIKFTEVMKGNINNSDKGTFIDIGEIINAINSKTKLIIIANPNNPTGEIYSKEDLKKLVKIAKEKNIFILSDEVFYDLIFQKNQTIETDVIAAGFDAMDNIITVKSLSKNRNLPGLRIGYIFSKNKDLIKNIGSIQEERVFFATASNFKTIVAYDCFFQSVRKIKDIDPKKLTEEAIAEAKDQFNDVSLFTQKSGDFLKQKYIDFENYMVKTNLIYSDYFDFMIRNFGKEITDYSGKQTGFNTFIKIKGINAVNIFDFCLNLYLTTGVKIEAAPYFGFDQKTWENLNYGFWMRFTFAQDKKTMKEGIKKFIDFKKAYISSRANFLRFNLQF